MFIPNMFHLVMSNVTEFQYRTPLDYERRSPLTQTATQVKLRKVISQTATLWQHLFICLDSESSMPVTCKCQKHRRLLSLILDQGFEVFSLRVMHTFMRDIQMQATTAFCQPKIYAASNALKLLCFIAITFDQNFWLALF